jgi:hypothetical protein
MTERRRVTRIGDAAIVELVEASRRGLLARFFEEDAPVDIAQSLEQER